MNYLVETKKEFTTQLVNILAPLIYEGIGSIYDIARKTSPPNEELMTFQRLLKNIPGWSDDILKTETERIMTLSNCRELLTDLVNAIIKANIMVLTNTPPEKKDTLKITSTIEFGKLVHKCYIETARNVYQNPFLFYHDYPLFELKRNERDALELIKASIKEAIRKMLPLKMILKEYLGNSFKEETTVKPDFDKVMTEDERNNLNAMATAVNTEGGKVEKFALEKKAEHNTEQNKHHTTDAHTKQETTQQQHAGGKTGEHGSYRVEHDDADSVSYYRKPMVEDSFSNQRTQAKTVMVTQPSRDSYTIEMSNNGTDIESIRKRIGERFRKNAPDFYKV